MKLEFSLWLEQNTIGTEYVDESKIDSIYDKAKLSVKLVQLYDETRSADPKANPEQKKLLLNINTILPLSTGVYGLYVSAENKKIIGNEVLNQMRLIFPKDVMLNQKLQTLSNAVIKKYIPNVDEKQIQPSDTIHVNVSKMIAQFGDSIEAIVEIASTIVHEATHDLELHYYGKTDETRTKQAENKFIAWVFKSWATIVARIPELRPYDIKRSRIKA